MELLHDKEKNYQTFSFGNTKIMFDNNGYIVKAKGFRFIMWATKNQDEELIGKHIIDLAKMLKKYAINEHTYISFLENVVLNFYEIKEKDTNEICYVKDECANKKYVLKN